MTCGHSTNPCRASSAARTKRSAGSKSKITSFLKSFKCRNPRWLSSRKSWTLLQRNQTPKRQRSKRFKTKLNVRVWRASVWTKKSKICSAKSSSRSGKLVQQWEGRHRIKTEQVSSANKPRLLKTALTKQTSDTVTPWLRTRSCVIK